MSLLKLGNRGRWIALISVLVLIVAGAVVWVALRLSSSGTTTAIACDDLGVMPCERQNMVTRLPLSGLDVRLVYSADRTPGRTADKAPSSADIGLGGWSLSILDSLDVKKGIESTGDGDLRHVHPVAVTIGTGRYAVASVDGSQVSIFDAAGREVASYQAATGMTALTFAWGTNGLTSVSDPDGKALTVRRDASGTPTAIDSLSGDRTLLGTVSGRLAAVGYPDETRAVITSTNTGLVTGLRDTAGGLTQYAYDGNGLLTMQKTANGATTRMHRSTKKNQVTVTTTTPTGATVTDTVTQDGDTVRRTHDDPFSGTVSMETKGNHRTMHLADGRVVNLDVSPDPRWGIDAPVVAKVSSGSATATEKRTGAAPKAQIAAATSQTFNAGTGAFTVSYDPSTRTSSSTRPDGSRVVAGYDTTGRITSITQPGQPKTAYHRDKSGRIDRITVGEGAGQRIWRYSYAAGKITVTDPLGNQQVRSFTANGSLAEVDGPGDFAATLSTDPAGRLTGFATPGQAGYQIARRDDGQPSLVTPPDTGDGLSATTYDYDAAGRLTTVTATGPSGDQKTTIAWGQNGHVSSLDSGAGAWKASYDGAGQLTSMSGPGASTTLTRSNGTLTGVRTQGPIDVTVKRSVDGSGRVSAETVGASPAVAYAFDSNGRATRVGDARISGPADGHTLVEKVGVVTRTWTYNQFSEAVSEVIADGGQSVAGVAWQRDAAGRVTSEAVTVNGSTSTTTYRYDGTERLAQVNQDGKTTSYRYDKAGNVTSVSTDGSTRTLIYNARDQLTSADGVQYSYDASGRLAKAVGPDGATTYTYDQRGALLQVKLASGQTVDYVTDGFGRRVARKVDGKVTTGWAYGDGSQPLAELSTSGAVQARYVYTGGSAPTYVVKGGVDYLELFDSSGSPIAAVSANNGIVADTIVRDAWGAVTSESSSGFQDIGASGGISDPATGLVRLGQRDYAPGTGSWTAPDPLGFAGSGPNLYAYVSGDPVNRVDPSGTCDYANVGIQISGAAGIGGSITLGYAWTDTQGGAFVTGGLGGGLKLGTGIEFTCLERTEDNDKPPSLDDFGGLGASGDLQAAPVGGGLDVGFGNGGISSAGYHIDGTLGGGLSGVVTNTEHWCWFGCPDTPGGNDSNGTPSVDDLPPLHNSDGGAPDGGTGDNSSDPGNSGNEPSGSDNPGNMCQGAGSCSQPPNSSSPDLPSAPGSGGDPHLTTADGIRFDLQRVGEFLALKADNADLTVQVRQQPMPGSNTIAINTGFAISAYGQKIEADRIDDADDLAIRVNGKAPSGTGADILPNGATLIYSNSTLTLITTQGSTLILSGTSIFVELSPDLKGHVHGLLGPYTGQGATHVETRSGQQIQAAQLKDATTLAQFGDSWRLKQSESLFTYPAGKSTSSYTDPSFPDPNAPAVDPGVQAVAKRLCGQVHLSGQALTDCVYDVSVSRNAKYAATTLAAARAAAQVIPAAVKTAPATTRPTATPTTPTSQPTVTVHNGDTLHDGSVVTGTITKAGQTVEYPIDAGTATVARLYAVTGDQNALHIDLIGPEANEPGFIVTSNYQYQIDPTKKYKLKVSYTGDTTGAFGFRFVTAKERRINATVSAPISGTLDVSGRVDIYVITAPASGKLSVTASGSCPGFSLGFTNDSVAPRIFSPLPACSTADLGSVVAGQKYDLIIWSDAGGTGPYAFDTSLTP